MERLCLEARDVVIVVGVERLHEQLDGDRGRGLGGDTGDRVGDLAGIDEAVVIRVDGVEGAELIPEGAGERLDERHLHVATAPRGRDARRALRGEADERLDR